MSERKQWKDMTKREKRAAIWFIILTPVVVGLVFAGPIGWILILVLFAIIGWLGFFDDLSRAAGNNKEDNDE